MAEFLHYLHHLWFDPLSEAERFEAFLRLGLPIMLLWIVIGATWALVRPRRGGDDDG